MLAGCNKLQSTKDYLLATGRGKQLNFRDHSALGVVAVYEEYMESHTHNPDLGLATLNPDLALNRGTDDMPYLRLTILEGLGSMYHNGKSFSTAMLVAPGSVLLDLDLTELAEVDRISREDDRCQTMLNHFSFTDYFTRSKDISNPAEVKAIVTLLFAELPTSAELFPTRAVNFRQTLGMICRAAHIDQNDFESIIEHLLKDQTAMETLGERSDKPEVDSREKLNWTRGIERSTMEDKLTSQKFVLSMTALKACFGWMSDAEYFDKLNPVIIASTRRHLRFQLHEGIVSVEDACPRNYRKSTASQNVDVMTEIPQLDNHDANIPNTHRIDPFHLEHDFQTS
jgi:hypothetical protein